MASQPSIEALSMADAGWAEELRAFIDLHRIHGDVRGRGIARQIMFACEHCGSTLGSDDGPLLSVSWTMERRAWK
jgi:hypothetical protein